MKSKNLTPFLFGAKVCSRRPPQPEVTLVVKGTFALVPGKPVEPLPFLEQDFLTAEVFGNEDDERAGECLYGGDFADFKLNAEVLLRGTCHAPRGEPVTECLVRFAVGAAWSKTLRAVGPRVWTDGVFASFSAPKPFVRMPLTYANTFGGPGHGTNPAGRGLTTADLPTVELAAGPVLSSRSDRPPPASFGPINPAWPERAGKVGRDYGKAYREARAPFYSADFDWSHFSAAPADQQLPGYLKGDEEIAFLNLHPDVPFFSTRLPGQRVRAFLKDTTGRFREVLLSLDTLFADLDAGKLVLTWRGVSEVRETDLTDVATVLIASEGLDEAAKPEAHYLERLEAFERDPLGRKEALAAAGMPEGEEEATASPPSEPLSDFVRRKLGKLPGEVMDKLRQALGQAAPHLPREALEKGLEKAEQQAAETPPVPILPLGPDGKPAMGMRQVVRSLVSRAADLKKVPGQEKTVAQLEQIANDPRWKQVDPGYEPPGPPGPDEPGPGSDLEDRDLSYRDLHGLDLSGAKLAGAILTGANLSGAKLAGANLRAAVLKADLTGADLTGADLTNVNAARANAARADLRGATLNQAFFEDADLSGAELGSVSARQAVLTRAKLIGAKAAGTAWTHCQMTGAVLDGADFRGASFHRVKLDECSGRELDLGGAKLSASTFADADLRRACLADVRGKGCLFLRAKLDGADLSRAALGGTHFTEASAVGARFVAADLPETRFYRAALDGADFTRANLFAADLCKAKLDGTKLTGANLYLAKLLQAGGKGCDLSGANLKRSTLEGA